MELTAEIDKQIKEAVQKRKALIVEAMGGRTQKYICTHTGINETKLSKWVNGIGDLEATEIDNLSSFLGIDK